MNEISTKKIVTDSVNYDEEKMKKLFREIARRLHTERIRQDYSTSQLALRADINAATIYRIERNSGEVSLRGLIKLSIALNRPLGYFVPIEETYNIKTAGERFEELTKDLDPAAMNILFSIINNTIKCMHMDSTKK